MTGKRRWGARVWFWALVLLVVGVVTYRHRASLLQAIALIGEANLWWLVPGAVAIGGVYLCRAAVYAIPLRLFDFRFTRAFLWSIAVVATSLHQLIPAGGASGYAFLTYAMHQRGVSAGQASLIALIDTLSYAVAIATLVVASLVYLAAAGLLGGSFLVAFLPGVVVLALAVAVYGLQRDRRRFTALVLRAKDGLARLLRRRWPDRPVRRFLDEYYAGKEVIGRRPGPFLRMVAYQYLAVACDAAALYTAFLAIGATPPLWVAFMGFVLAMAGVAVVAAPAGGGSFEVVLSAFLATHGVPPAQAIAAALLFRVIAFWLPAVVSVVLLLSFRRRRREIRAGRG